MRRKKIKQALVLMLVSSMLLIQAVQVQAATKQLPSGIAYNEIGSQIEEFVSKHEDTTAGMAVSVFGQNETFYTNYFGYADKEAEVVVNEDTVMEWGSATKLLVWVSVMQLWEQGKLDLEADIQQYLPEDFLTNLKYEAPITMTHLMNHNAGFQEVYADLFVKESEAILTLGEALAAHKPEQIYEPSAVTAYSNWGVALAGYIVEQISGESFNVYVKKHIFEPLGMEHSALAADLRDNVWVQEKRKELQCYTVDGELIPECFYYINLYPAGMCTSTLSDFEVFAKALLDEESPLFQNVETWETLFTPTSYFGDSEVPSNYHGFWMVPYGVETVGHGGNTAGCSSYLLLNLENKVGVVVMTNQSGESVYNSEMMELIFGKYSSENYFDTKRTAPEGIYRPARTVRIGPFKLMSLSFMGGEEQTDEFWMVGTSESIEKICYPYADYVRVPMWEFVWELVLVLLWVLGLLFSILSLAIKLIHKIVNTCRKKPYAIALGGWSTLATSVQVVAALLMVWVATQALSYAVASTYMWSFIVFAGLAGAMIGMIVYGVVNIRKRKSSKMRKLYNWTTMVFLIVGVANILYWNLFMGWKV